MKKVKSNSVDFQKKLSKDQLIEKLVMKNLKGGIGCPPPVGINRSAIGCPPPVGI